MPIQSAPLVSAIIPTYRRPALLKRAILSVLAQDGPPLQVCVYDNASGDETASVVAEIAAKDPRVRYHCHERNIGAVANFQYGLAQVSTQFFTFLSDDDVQLPGFFKEAMRGFESFPDAMFWAGLTVRMTAEGAVFDARVGNWPREGLFSPPEGLFEMMQGQAPTWTGAVFRQKIIESIGLLDADVKGAVDLDYLLRIAARYAFVISKQAVAIFVLNPSSFSEQEPFSAFWPGWLKMIDNISAIEQLAPKSRAAAVEILHKDARRMLFRRAASAISRGRYDFARQAADALNGHYRKKLRGNTIQGLAFLAEEVPIFQALYHSAYATMERLILSKRRNLQERYGHLASKL